MSIAFIISKQKPQQVFEIKLNPDLESIKRLDEICEARGSKDHMVVWLTNDQYYNLAYFMR